MTGFKPDIVHCHDWQTGIIPVYLKERFHEGEFYRDMKSIMTIHNLKFQGIYDMKTIKDVTGLPDSYFTPDKLEAYKDANFLKGGIVYADKITTVSRSYAEEIKTPFYGEKLDGLMRARSNDLWGIVNGIDYDEYNPETDTRIPHNYNQITFRKENIRIRWICSGNSDLKSTLRNSWLVLYQDLQTRKGLTLSLMLWMSFVQKIYSLLFSEQVRNVMRICSAI